MASPNQQQPNSPKQEEKQPWNNQLGAMIVKAIATGGLGGVGVFVASLNSSDLPALAAGGALGAVITPIATQLWNPIGKKIGKAAGFGGEAIAEGGESLFQQWLSQLSKAEQGYLNAMKAYCSDLEVEGFSKGLPTLSLPDIFVPLQLSSDSAQVRPSGQREATVEIWDFLPSELTENSAQHQRLAIIASPGYGKTTLARHLTYCYSCPKYQDYHAKQLFPIFLRFRTLYKTLPSNLPLKEQPGLETIAINTIKSIAQCEDLNITEAWLKKKLENGQCLVILDGLDEVPEEGKQRIAMSRLASYQMQRFPSVFILTSRPHGYNASLFQGVKELKILDFTNPQKQDFLRKWYRIERWEHKWSNLWRSSLRRPEAEQYSEETARELSQKEAKEAAENLYQQIINNSVLNYQLAINPLLLTLIAATHEVDGALPERRVKVYENMFRLLLESRPNLRDVRLTLKEAQPNRILLQKLAVKLSDGDDTQFTLEKAERWIGPWMQQHQDEATPLTVPLFLKEIEEISGLLAGGESDRYEFSHKTFQEYLTALEFYNQDLEMRLRQRLRESDWKSIEDWKEIFSFYAALKNADFLAEEIAKMPEGDKQRESTVLLNHIVSTEKSKITATNRQHLKEWMAGIELMDLKAEQVAIISLEQRFQNMIELEDGVSVTTGAITWNEYQEFLESQEKGQFHSTAEPQEILLEQGAQPVTGISLTDQNWFCAWLATQTSLQAETSAVYDYRILTPEQYEQAGLERKQRFHIARVPLELKYQKLVNLLANSAWKEADQETNRLMLKICGKDSNNFLDSNDLKTFPCTDLHHIDQLWVKNSGGIFGFTVQKKIWEECGSPMDYNNAWLSFGDRVGWRAQGEWLSYESLTPSLSSLRGNFPSLRVGLTGVGWLKEVFSLLLRPDL